MVTKLKSHQQRLKVLLIEDSRVYAKKVSQILTEKSGTIFLVDYADKLSGGLKRLQKGGMDVVLLDLTLPDSEGLKTLDRVRVRAPEIPIVILTGIEDENLGLEALKKGAQDYLVKDRVDAPLLMRAVRYAVERHRIQMEHEREHRALKHFAGPKRRGRAVSRLKLIENYSVVVKAYMTHDANASVDKAVQTAGIFAGAGLSGKEVIKIHLETLDRLTEGMAANDAQLVVWKARFLLLGVLSNVVDLYRMKNEDK